MWIKWVILHKILPFTHYSCYNNNNFIPKAQISASSSSAATLSTRFDLDPQDLRSICIYRDALTVIHCRINGENLVTHSVEYRLDIFTD